ncbi:MAG: DUF4258 domain-containing protein [Xanthomonadaceae bacterium]|nr:DUF4258 domain-containing protein [Xanthomonadaceae bacterium]
MKKWVLTPHAAQRIQERKIFAEELDELIQSPEESIRQGAKFILTKTFRSRKDNKIAAVVLEKKENNLWLVLTLMVNFRVRK